MDSGVRRRSRGNGLTVSRLGVEVVGRVVAAVEVAEPGEVAAVGVALILETSPMSNSAKA